MKSSCTTVAERVALGEPFTEPGELAEHVASCAGCQAIVAMPGQLAATRHEVNPGLGFASRMTAGAQHRIAIRKRRRVAGGLAAAVAAGAAGLFLVTRSPEPSPVQPVAVQIDRHDTTEPTRSSDEADDAEADLKALVELADVDRNQHLSARWKRINKPLAPYRALLKGVTP